MSDNHQSNERPLGYKWWQWVLGFVFLPVLILMIVGVSNLRLRPKLSYARIWLYCAIPLVVFLVCIAIVTPEPDESETLNESRSAAASQPKVLPTATSKESPRVAAATATPEPAPEPKRSLRAGMYQVGSDIQPGIYAGKAGTDIFGACYWARLSGASGDFSELTSNENAIGQFYVEIRPSDKYFEVACGITPLDDWPKPGKPLSEIEPGMYLVGRDINAGTYRGDAGTDVVSSCYWARLSGLSGGHRSTSC